MILPPLGPLYGCEHTRLGPFPAPKTKKPKQMFLKQGLQCVYGMKFLQRSPQVSLNLRNFNCLHWSSHWTASLLKSLPRAGSSPDLCISKLLFDAYSRGPPSRVCLRSSSAPKIDFLVFYLVWTPKWGPPSHILLLGRGGGGVAGSRPHRRDLEECWKPAGAV